MRDLFAGGALLAQGLGDLADAARRLLGDRAAGEAGLELVRIEEDGVQDLVRAWRAQVLQAHFVHPVRRVGEVGVDHDAVHVADDEQRRVLERLAIGQELAVGGVEVLVLPLVLPAEAALLPDVGPAVLATDLLDATLEAERLPSRVRLCRRILAEQLAEVEEVLLGRRAFSQFGAPPLRDELLCVHEMRLSHERHGPGVREDRQRCRGAEE